MTGFLLDTNLVSDFARPDGDAGVKAWMSARPATCLYISTVTVAEIAFGIERLDDGRRKDGFRLWLDQVLHQFDGRILSFDTSVALLWGALRAQLYRAGRQKPGLDLQIAAVALHHGLSLVTRNETDFAGLGITLINPWKASRTPS